MNSKRAATLAIMLVMAVLLVCGMVMIFTSHAAGERSGNAAMRASGGAMDTQLYLMAISDGARSALVGGAAMAALGGGGFLICLKARLDEREK